MTIALIDTDVLVYWSAFAMQKTKYVYDDVVYGSHKEMKEAVGESLDKEKVEKYVDLLPRSTLDFICRRNLRSVLEAVGTKRHELWLTGDTNYRDDVAVTKKYKDRLSAKPILFQDARDWFVNRGAKVKEPFEADDIISSRSFQVEKGVICTIDKDLDMVPGLHYNWNTGKKYRISHNTGTYKFLIQLITGDSVDTIPGLAGYGPKKAAEVVREAGSPENAFKAVRELYNDDVYLTEQARLLWMKRSLTEPLWDIDWFIKEIL